MPSQAAEAEKTEAYLSSDSSSGQLEHQDIFNRELTKDDNSTKARTNPMSIAGSRTLTNEIDDYKWMKEMKRQQV